MMTKEEYLAKSARDEEWAPGWEAIDTCTERLYPGQEPAHYGTLMTERAIFGGNEFLDGYSIYVSPHGYRHIVTYGMSELYANEESFGGEYSKWGYEMTFKLAASTNEDCMWAIDMLAYLALYTNKSGNFFEPYHFLYSAKGNSSFPAELKTNLKALLFVEDTEMPGIETVHGRLDFLQVVGITQAEADALVRDAANAKVLAERMQADDPYLVTDLAREGYISF